VVSVDERRDRGRSRRGAVPRSSLADLVVPSRDPVTVVLADDAGRDADLVPVRHHRMAASAFTFYRGSAGLMAGDLAAGPTTGLTVQLCGDAHLSNFGLFATPERRLTFDLNDFDETHPGPWEWDLKRLMASVHLAAAAAGHAAEVLDRSVLAAAEVYRLRMADYAETRTLDVWYDAIDLDTSLPSVRRAENRRILRDVMDRARRRTGQRAAARLTEVGPEPGTIRFRSDVPLMWRLAGTAEVGDPDRDRQRLDAVLARYRSTLSPERATLLEQFRIVDIARKVVGVGSVGTRCWILLLQGPLGADDVVILQAKESGSSVLEAHTAPSAFPSHGERVVRGQRLMQAAGDPFLGFTAPEDDAADAYVRQLWDMKGSIDAESLSPPALEGYARLCGAVLARAHARSGLAPEISGYLGRKAVADRALAEFARRYAAVAVGDHERFTQAIADGRVVARPDRLV
jgi:uncharacterized protein (DUF2252 family)